MIYDVRTGDVDKIVFGANREFIISANYVDIKVDAQTVRIMKDELADFKSAMTKLDEVWA
jgi:hypothetical protein